MRIRLFTAAAVAALTALVPAAHANTYYERVVVPDLKVAPFAGTTARGLTCGLVTTGDPTTPNVESGVMVVGPVVFDPAGTDGIVCSVHINNGTHAGFASVSIPGVGVSGVVQNVAQMAYVATLKDDVYLCTEWHHNNGVVYYDAALGVFAAAPTVPCVHV